MTKLFAVVEVTLKPYDNFEHIARIPLERLKSKEYFRKLIKSWLTEESDSMTYEKCAELICNKLFTEVQNER